MDCLYEQYRYMNANLYNYDTLFYETFSLYSCSWNTIWLYIDILIYSFAKKSEEGFLDYLYEKLERVYNGLSGHCIQIILGAINSQVGWKTIYRSIICNESIHVMSNRNETRLIEFVMVNNLIVSR